MESQIQYLRGNSCMYSRQKIHTKNVYHSWPTDKWLLTEELISDDKLRWDWSTHHSYWENSLHIIKPRKAAFATSFHSLARVIFYGAFIIEFQTSKLHRLTLQGTFYARGNSYQPSVLYIIFGTLTSCSVLKGSISFDKARSTSLYDE